MSSEVLAPEVELEEIESNDSYENLSAQKQSTKRCPSEVLAPEVKLEEIESNENLCAEKQFFDDIANKSVEHNSSILFNESDSNSANTSKSEKKSFVCDICNRTLSSYRILIKHLMIHTGEKHSCEICGKDFRLERNLKIHVRTVHLKERNYQCDTCGKCFGFQKTLSDHKLTHTNKKPHVCKICSKSFKQIGHLQSHYNTHRIFECEVCDATFNTKRHLDCHVLVHTENSYMCEICKKGFKKIYSLKSHSKTHEL